MTEMINSDRDSKITKLSSFITWLEKWSMIMRQIEKDVAIKNLKEMYEEISEISEDGKLEIDLDLLFLDIIEAIGLNAADHLAKINR